MCFKGNDTGLVENEGDYDIEDEHFNNKTVNGTQVIEGWKG